MALRRIGLVGLLGATVLCVIACEQRGGYPVVVHLPGDAARAARVELSVLSSCGEIHSLGDAPVSPWRVIEAEDGSAIGTLPAGRYGLYARVWRADCSLYAAGCAPFDVTAGGRGTIEVFLTEVEARTCAADQTCVSGRCEGGADAGEPDGGDEWRLHDVDDPDFALGSPSNTTLVADGGVRLRPDESTGVFTSRTLAVPVADAHGRTLSWVPRSPYGKDLPGAAAGPAEAAAYADAGADVQDLVLLLHFEGAVDAALGDGDRLVDSSGNGHDAEMVDLAGLQDSGIRNGRIGSSVFLRRDDYLRIPDAPSHVDFAFGTGDFTWAAWVRIDGCEPSEDNVIALGGEVPHIWLGALCPQGIAWWQVHDDDHGGDGVGSVDGIVDGVWHHLVGIKAAGRTPRTALYVDGELVASQVQDYGVFSNFTKELLIGNFPIGTAPVYTYRSELTVDELAVFKRALSSEEILSLYRRGALRLRLQVRACPADGCDRRTFVGPDGTGTSFFSELDNPDAALPPTFLLPADLQGVLFQYQATLDSAAPGLSPVLDEVELVVGLP